MVSDEEIAKRRAQLVNGNAAADRSRMAAATRRVIRQLEVQLAQQHTALEALSPREDDQI